MGSGETAPTMVRTHQELFARLPPSSTAALVETPYGFQENADEISERAAGYFARNVGHPIEPVGLRAGRGVDRGTDDAAVARLQAADLVFAGPGSPTYALDQWRGSPFADVLASKLRTGGIVVFASAAAVGLGHYAVPVYEIYKVGAAPRWVDGLDLMSIIGLDAAVIPHFDNAEGGTHDTRFCYLGGRRLALMEQQLPVEAHVIGVDEHTALILDLDAGSAAVRGRGQVTVRRGGVDMRIVPAGRELSLSDLTRVDGGTPTLAPDPAPARAAGDERPPAALTLPEQMAASTTAFDRALERRDGPAAATAILELEAAITQWSADTNESDEADRARAALRGLIVRLGDAAAKGLADPVARIAPLLDAVVRTRETLRDRRDYALADRLRDAADEAGVHLRDTPHGTTWHVDDGAVTVPHRHRPSPTVPERP